MANESKKCAHLACLCMAPAGEKYCSQFCKDAGTSETEIACDCGHSGLLEVIRGSNSSAVQTASRAEDFLA